MLFWLKPHISLVNVIFVMTQHFLTWCWQVLVFSIWNFQFLGCTKNLQVKDEGLVFTYPVNRVRCGKPVTLWAHWQFLHKMEGSILLVRHSTITVVDDVILYSFFSEISLKNSHRSWKKIASKKSKIFCHNRVFGTHAIAHM